MCLLDVALDRHWLTERWLYGLPLRDPATRLPFPDAHYAQAIRQAMELGNDEFGIDFCPTDVEEITDLSQWSASTYFLTNLARRPLIEVTACDLYWGKQHMRSLLDAVDVQSQRHSQIQFDAYALSGASNSYTYTGRTFADRKPSIRWRYRAGYAERSLGAVTATRNQATLTVSAEADLKAGDIVGFLGEEARFVLRRTPTVAYLDRPWSKTFTDTEATATSLPAILLEYLGLSASVPILVTAGDLVIGAGIASLSRSIDSLSQSINTTSSAENSAYSARIKSNQASLKEIKERMMRTFKPIDTFMI